MDTLYFSPGSCSLIVHCLFGELGIEVQSRKVDLAAREHKAAAFLAINPKGKVPVLVTPDGALTECMAILESVCDRHDASGQWLGKPGSRARARTLERTATLATEIHPAFGRFFHAGDYADSPAVAEGMKQHADAWLVEWFRQEDAKLTGATWSGSGPDISDLYFLVLARWGRRLATPANRMPRIEAFTQRMGERAGVQRGLAAEGIPLFGN